MKCGKADNPDLSTHGTSAANGSGAEWLDLHHLTRYANLSERTLRAWITSEVDPLPAVRVRGKILISRSKFDAYLERHPVKPLDLGAIVDELVEAVTDGR